MKRGYTNSVAPGYLFSILPAVNFVSSSFLSNGVFQTGLSGETGKSYVFQASTNLSDWISLSTNSPATNPFNFTDPDASNFLQRYYRVLQQP